MKTVQKKIIPKKKKKFGFQFLFETSTKHQSINKQLKIRFLNLFEKVFYLSFYQLQQQKIKKKKRESKIKI